MREEGARGGAVMQRSVSIDGVQQTQSHSLLVRKMHSEFYGD